MPLPINVRHRLHAGLDLSALKRDLNPLRRRVVCVLLALRLLLLGPVMHTPRRQEEEEKEEGGEEAMEDAIRAATRSGTN